MLNYKLIERRNPQAPEADKKVYAIHQSKGQKELSDIFLDIDNKSALSSGDISSVILNLVDQIPKYLLDGHSVSLGDLGSLHLTFNSEGAENAEAFDTNMIQKINIRFVPGAVLKNKIAQATFNKV